MAQGYALRSASRWRGARDCSPHPWGSPLRAARYGASLRLSKFVPDEFVEPRGFVHTSLSARYAKRPARGRFAYLAEREGFEPSIRLLTLYSLSRGAPSATRASLRVCGAAAGSARITADRLEVKPGCRDQCSSPPEAGPPPASCSPLMR